MQMAPTHGFLKAASRRAERERPFTTFEIEETCALVARLHQSGREVVATESHYQTGFLSTRHCHTRGQVSYALDGAMTVSHDGGSANVPPFHAIWIPPGLTHQAHARGGISLFSVYVEPRAMDEMPDTCVVFKGSDLLHVLMREIVGRQSAPGDPAFDAAALLLRQEFLNGPSRDIAMPMPRDARLLRICQRILAEPTIEHGKDELARIGNVSRRTLTRLFQAELGMTYSDWRQRALLLEAVRRLEAGEPVTNVALDLGYESPSAFTAMFRRRMGRLPSAVRPRGDVTAGGKQGDRALAHHPLR